jgi:hypothetical protein
VTWIAPSLFSAGYQWRIYDEQKMKIQKIETELETEKAVVTDIQWIKKALDDNKSDHQEIQKELRILIARRK